MHAARRAGNGFVHQCAAEIVGPGLQAQRGALGTHLDPRDLNILNQWMQHQPGDCVHEYSLTERRSRPRAPFSPQGRFHVDVTQWHEFGYASGARLQLAQA